MIRLRQQLADDLLKVFFVRRGGSADCSRCAEQGGGVSESIPAQPFVFISNGIIFVDVRRHHVCQMRVERQRHPAGISFPYCLHTVGRVGIGSHMPTDRQKLVLAEFQMLRGEKCGFFAVTERKFIVDHPAILLRPFAIIFDRACACLIKASLAQIVADSNDHRYVQRQHRIATCRAELIQPRIDVERMLGQPSGMAGMEASACRCRKKVGRRQPFQKIIRFPRGVVTHELEHLNDVLFIFCSQFFSCHTFSSSLYRNNMLLCFYALMSWRKYVPMLLRFGITSVVLRLQMRCYIVLFL